MRLIGRRLHIAGSAHPHAHPALIVQAHRIVRRLVREALREGATLVVQAGPEPLAGGADLESPALVFDWTILEEARACLLDGTAEPTRLGEP